MEVHKHNNVDTDIIQLILLRHLKYSPFTGMNPKEAREFVGSNHHFNPNKNPQDMQKGSWWDKFKNPGVTTKPIKVCSSFCFCCFVCFPFPYRAGFKPLYDFYKFILYGLTSIS